MANDLDTLRFHAIRPMSLPKVRPASSPEVTKKESGGRPSGFDRQLEEVMAGQERKITFSKHAATRMESRDIEMSASDLARLDQAVRKLEAKGARSSLVLSDAAAWIVNVPERRVVTAMDRGKLKENVFTNIDSTIVI